MRAVLPGQQVKTWSKRPGAFKPSQETHLKNGLRIAKRNPTKTRGGGKSGFLRVGGDLFVSKDETGKAVNLWLPAFITREQRQGGGSGGVFHATPASGRTSLGTSTAGVWTVQGSTNRKLARNVAHGYRCRLMFRVLVTRAILAGRSEPRQGGGDQGNQNDGETKHER